MAQPAPAAAPATATATDTATATLATVAASLPGFDPGNVAVATAQAFLARLLTPAQASESVALEAALNRILSDDQISPIDVPGQDNAAMDGYALRGSDLAPAGPTSLIVTGTLLAGGTLAPLPGPGQCLRIMTGAPLPPGLDTVVPQERVDSDGERIRIPAGTIVAGAHCRRAGEDLARGRIALSAGRVLQAPDLGLLASLGLASVPVRPKLKIAFFSTGNELQPVGTALAPGCLYDSNRYTVRAMVERLGFDMLDFGIVRDEPRTLARTLRTAAASADAIITSGGVGVGEADHTATVFQAVGEAMFWSLALRPGRPFVIGRIDRDAGAGARALASARTGPGANPAILFGLPGNPVAAMVVFLVLVRAALLQLAGAAPQPIASFAVTVAEPIRKRVGRSEYIRARLVQGDDGCWQAVTTGPQGSGILSSMSEADGLLVLEPARGDVAAGETVPMLPLRGLL